MKQRTHPTTWLMLVCALLFAACAQLGLQEPKSFEDRVQYTKAGIGAAYRTIGDNVAAKTMSAARGAEAFGKLDTLEKQVGLAEQLQKGGKPVDAMSTITLAMNALTVLRGELAKKGTP
jgi:hypothetical protein